MKKLVILALVCLVVPAVASASSTPDAPAVQEGAVEIVEAPAMTVDASDDIATEANPALEDLLFTACLDSGIACTSASQCEAICAPYTCVCRGTCQICSF